MVIVEAGESRSFWFGIAWEDDAYVATAFGADRDEAIRIVKSCIPDGVAYEVSPELSRFGARAVDMLGRLESGDETGKEFVFSRKYRSASMYRILNAAASIPIGYVTTYGNIADAAGSEARAVGRAMATNPLYPIIPCHRVVGADMALVGYGGRQDEEALAGKLGRLVAEARRFTGETEVELVYGKLTVVPVERVILAAERHRERRILQAKKLAVREETERLQNELF